MSAKPNPWLGILTFSGLGGEEMFDWLSPEADNAVTMLKRDHDTVKELFDQFEKANRQAAKKKIARQALDELRIHALLEEEIFYPAMRSHMPKEEITGIMNEADEEHHVARMLIAELGSMDGSEDRFNAKFTVLAENVRHHIKEEEDEMLPKAEDLPIDLKALGQQMEVRRRELKSAGVPPTPEDRMVSRTNRRISSRLASSSGRTRTAARKSRKAAAPRSK
jgi:hypothetical protein